MNKMLPGTNSELEEYLPFSDVDLIITDIDGTLISGSDSVIKQIKQIIKNLKQQKVYLTVATGRTFYGAKYLLKELNIRVGMPIVLYNGSVVIQYGTSNILYSNFIDCKDVDKLLQVLPLDLLSIYVYTFKLNNNVFNGAVDDFFIEKVYGIGKNNTEYDVNGLKVEWIEPSKIWELHINAILIDKTKLDHEQIRNIIDFLIINNNVLFTDSGNGFIEIKAKGLSKGIIFKFLRHQNKFEFKKILAIGDNDNDKELFEFADISVAVENSSVGAVEKAHYFCESESANGFLDMLHVIKAAKKYFKDKGV